MKTKSNQTEYIICVISVEMRKTIFGSLHLRAMGHSKSSMTCCWNHNFYNHFENWTLILCCVMRWNIKNLLSNFLWQYNIVNISTVMVFFRRSINFGRKYFLFIRSYSKKKKRIFFIVVCSLICVSITNEW